jgi:hypothetical protein
MNSPFFYLVQVNDSVMVLSWCPAVVGWVAVVMDD